MKLSWKYVKISFTVNQKRKERFKMNPKKKTLLMRIFILTLVALMLVGLVAAAVAQAFE